MVNFYVTFHASHSSSGGKYSLIDLALTAGLTGWTKGVGFDTITGAARVVAGLGVVVVVVTRIIDGRFMTGGNGGIGRLGADVGATAGCVGLTGIIEGKLIFGRKAGAGGGVGMKQSAFSAPFSQQYGNFAPFGH